MVYGLTPIYSGDQGSSLAKLDDPCFIASYTNLTPDQLQVSSSYLSITKNQSDWLQAITYYN